MIINFESIEEKVENNFKGGEGPVAIRAFNNELGKIMRIRLEKGSAIGYHKHETNSEIMYVVSGTATVLYDDGKETAKAGEVTYCPKGHSHSLINEHDEPLVVFAVVAEQ